MAVVAFFGVKWYLNASNDVAENLLAMVTVVSRAALGRSFGGGQADLRHGSPKSS